MTEGRTRHLKGNLIEAWSAGTEPLELDPWAVKVMMEAGVDISNQYAMHVKEIMNSEFDYVVTLCGHANENCPFVPGMTRKVHVGFDNPLKLPEYVVKEEVPRHYRRIRDEIRRFVEHLPEVLESKRV